MPTGTGTGTGKGSDSLLCSCEWVASCTGCGEEGPYFVKNRLNPRGRRHTSHFLDGNPLKACGQFKRKPRLLPFRTSSSLFPDHVNEGGDSENTRKGGGGAVSGRIVDSVCAGMFVVYTSNDEEQRVARVSVV